MQDTRLISKIDGLAVAWEGLPAPQLLARVVAEMGTNVVQGSSMGAEDVVITHMLSLLSPRVSAFTLDTGRLNPETYALMDRLRERYKMDLEVLFPNAAAVEAMVRARGVNLFYDSVENRKECCRIRKLEPLARVMKKYSGWICGLRREQSPTRTDIRKIEIDVTNGGVIKVNPLADWTREQVWDFIKKNSIPYNHLHDQGYPSIGCAPCTRAVQPGEPERAGRWWWENPDTKECGLHKQ